MWELWQQHHTLSTNEARASFLYYSDSSAKENNNWKRWVRCFKTRDKAKKEEHFQFERIPIKCKRKKSKNRKANTIWDKFGTFCVKSFWQLPRHEKKRIEAQFSRTLFSKPSWEEFEQRLSCSSLRSNLCLSTVEPRCFYFLSNGPAVIHYWKGGSSQLAVYMMDSWISVHPVHLGNSENIVKIANGTLSILLH